MIKIKIHKDDCIQCGACVEKMPEVFVIDEKGIKLITKTLPDGKLEELRNVIDSCAGDAIELQ
jgi:ferredoxin